jgi:hypothetical protein
MFVKEVLAAAIEKIGRYVICIYFFLFFIYSLLPPDHNLPPRRRTTRTPSEIEESKLIISV